MDCPSGCPPFFGHACGSPSNDGGANWQAVKIQWSPKIAFSFSSRLFVLFRPFFFHPKSTFTRTTTRLRVQHPTPKPTPLSRTEQRLVTTSELALFKTALMKGRLSIFTSQVRSLNSCDSWSLTPLPFPPSRIPPFPPHLGENIIWVLEHPPGSSQSLSLSLCLFLLWSNRRLRNRVLTCLSL